MRLIKLILHKCKRLRLNFIDHLEYTPTAPTQFIVGTNGSGKSSLAYECSPLPPDKLEYDKGGYKYATFEKNNVYFTMKGEDIDGTWKYSFMRGNEELNEGGTISVQNQLVLEHFKYTPEIHSIIVGEVGYKFTSQSPAVRRKWFLALADNKYDYALGLYRRITDRYNESRHALKRSKERLVIESAKLLPEKELEHLRDLCSDLYTQVQKLIEQRKPLMDPSSNYIERSNKVAANLEGAALKVRGILKRLSRELPRDSQRLMEEIATVQATLTLLQTKADQFFEDFNRIQKLWDGMQATKLENAAQVQAQLESFQITIAQARAACVTKLSLTADPATTIASCDKILSWWPSVQDGFFNNTERGWGRQFLTDVTERIVKLQDIRQKLTGMIARAEEKMEHYNRHKDDPNIQCPACDHAFQPNFNSADLAIAEGKLKEYTKLFNDNQVELDKELELQNEVRTYLQHYSTVMQQLRNAPGLEEFTRWVAAELILVNSPSSFVNHLSTFRDDAGQMSRIEQAERKHEEVSHLAKELLARDTSGLSVEADRARLEQLIGDTEFEKSVTQERLKSLRTQHQQVEELMRLGDSLRHGIKEVDQLHYDAHDSLRREVFAQMLRELQSQLAFKEQALMAAERQQSVIEHIEGEIGELTRDAEDFKVLQKELSPTEGLIAEGINGFMRTMVEQMNQTTSMLFSYPLEILPCSPEGDSLNLDYKFPLMVNGEKRSDVSKGSSGMLEVIDLAYVIASMKARGMEDYPLFLDEFGRTLDPVHKQATVSFLTSLMDIERFEQVFMITHDPVQFNSIGRSEISALHASNITMPVNAAVNTALKMS